MSNALVPELYVSRLEESLRFYCDVLGFEVEYAREAERFVYLRKDGAELMLEEIGEKSWISAELSQPFGRGVNLQVKVSDVEALHIDCSNSSAIIKVPLESREYSTGARTIRQTQFVIEDPDGYLIRLAQVDE